MVFRRDSKSLIYLIITHGTICRELTRIICNQVNGRPLTEQFNELHENVKYLPGIKIPDAVVAHASLLESVEDANALIFVVPHQVSFIEYFPHFFFSLIF